MKRLAVLLSGRGSNFEAIADRIKEGKLLARIEVVVSNVDAAPALEKARQRGLNTVVLNSKELGKEKFEQTLEKTLKDLKVDLICLAGFMRILSPSFIHKFPNQILNIHPSILPKYRGPSPVVAAILNGDSKTGVSIMSLDKGMDTGPILAQKEIPITTKYTTPDLTSKLFHIGSELLIETLPKLLNGTIKYQHQNDSKSTYTSFLRKEDGNINWTNPAKQIANQIRAYIPWPGTYTYWKGQQLKILSAEPDDKFIDDQKPGQVLTSMNKNIIPVVTSKGLLLVDKLQMQGKNPLGAKEFLQGYPELVGDRLENSKV